MAEPGRAVRVSGLPADAEDERLKDKLLIHFLRARNGGGEIESVTVVKAMPVSALITFEDRRVAKRVIQHSPHILELDEKKYKVVVTEHRESLDPDKVFPRLSATVDYNQLPGGLQALTSLHRSHPDIQINNDAALELYTLHGAYSKVQAALMHLLGHPGGPQSAENKDAGQPAVDGSRFAQKPSPGGYGWEDASRRQEAAQQPLSTSEEDLILIVDADMFQYVQKYCRKEYQEILSRYDVEVVDVTNQGLTSLFLHVTIGVGDDGRVQECLNLARKEMCIFFQENEAKICRAQLPKSILSSKRGLQRAKENLSIRLPKLLLCEDDRNVFIIGSSRDVSEAKQFLLDSELRSTKESVASLRFPACDLGLLNHADEQRVSLAMSSVDSVNDTIDQLLRSEEDERRAEGARRYKLAAQFKDTGLAVLGNRPVDFSQRGGLSSAGRPKCPPGPMLGYDVLAGTAENAGQRVPRASAQTAGGDILFKIGDACPPAASMQSKTSLDSDLIDTRPKTNQSQSGGVPFPPAGSGSTLKRASSFSGSPQQKAQVVGQRSQDDASQTTNRTKTRSSSFRDKQGSYDAEMSVSTVIWQHIKEAYGARVEDLTSDVQVKESRSEGSSDMTVTFRGANPSKVSSCRLGLQKLLDSVHADFSVHVLQLSELGISDPVDETLQACCADVRNRFKKVTVKIIKKSLYLLGPQQLCAQVGASLREVFSGDLAKIADQQDLCCPSSSDWSSLTLLEASEDHSASLRYFSNPQVMLKGHSANAEGTGSGQERTNRSDFRETEPVNGSISQPLLAKDAVMKEKVKFVSAVDMDGRNTFVNTSKPGSDKSTNSVGPTTTCIDKDIDAKERTPHSTLKDGVPKRHTERGEDTPEESKNVLVGPGCICVCGDSEKRMRKTKCGATLCSKCLDTVHIHCRVCHETEPTPRGIQGEMSYSRLHISVPGYKKDYAIKVTYCIPDGIQEDGHPSPGMPFQGGVFEAYLPDCDKTRKLLPRLEKAFRQGLTFTVTEKETGGRVAWDCIPHKTSLHGGKSGNGYPDSTYFTRLSEVLTSYGIEALPDK